MSAQPQPNTINVQAPAAPTPTTLGDIGNTYAKATAMTPGYFPQWATGAVPSTLLHTALGALAGRYVASPILSRLYPELDEDRLRNVATLGGGALAGLPGALMSWQAYKGGGNLFNGMPQLKYPTPSKELMDEQLRGQNNVRAANEYVNDIKDPQQRQMAHSQLMAGYDAKTMDPSVKPTINFTGWPQAAAPAATAPAPAPAPAVTAPVTPTPGRDPYSSLPTAMGNRLRADHDRRAEEMRRSQASPARQRPDEVTAEISRMQDMQKQIRDAGLPPGGNYQFRAGKLVVPGQPLTREQQGAAAAEASMRGGRDELMADQAQRKAEMDALRAQAGYKQQAAAVAVDNTACGRLLKMAVGFGPQPLNPQWSQASIPYNTAMGTLDTAVRHGTMSAVEAANTAQIMYEAERDRKGLISGMDIANAAIAGGTGYLVGKAIGAVTSAVFGGIPPGDQQNLARGFGVGNTLFYTLGRLVS